MIPIDDAADPRVALYRGVSDPALLVTHGLFVAEGRLVVRRLLTESPFEVRSVLVNEHARAAIDDVLRGRDLPVYVAPQAVLGAIAGFNIHRGCLALGARPSPVAPGALLDSATSSSHAVVLDAVSNADNIGGIFRSVAALGGGPVLLGPGCADPLYRKAIRTSIGATLVVPYARTDGDWAALAGTLREHGYLVIALSPARAAEPIGTAARRYGARPRIALLAGAEGDGLSAAALACADVRVGIPMASGVDSLNVNVAVAIALHRLGVDGE